jgi:DNA invertase Pin-like site-specific DNA recombinase
MAQTTIGYGRTSTLEQIAGLEAQKRDLTNVGCDPDDIFVEQLSSVATKRPELEAAIKHARKGDVFVVTKIDRLARSIFDLLEIEKRLRDKNVSLRILTPAIDTATPEGRLNFNLFGSIAQFEREIMLQRQKEGIAKAKDDGKYKGRKPTARAKTADVLAQRAAGVPPSAIAKAMKISPASVYRIIADDTRERLADTAANRAA